MSAPRSIKSATRWLEPAAAALLIGRTWVSLSATASGFAPASNSKASGAAIHLLRSVREVDKLAPIGPAQLSALSVLVFVGPRTIGDLAAAEPVRSPTMSGIVAALETRGLVKREPNPNDRRSTLILATSSGKATLRDARNRRIAAIESRLIAAWLIRASRAQHRGRPDRPDYRPQFPPQLERGRKRERWAMRKSLLVPPKSRTQLKLQLTSALTGIVLAQVRHV
jgi:DNA-binding MarR family transcriptional regulator